MRRELELARAELNAARLAMGRAEDDSVEQVQAERAARRWMERVQELGGCACMLCSYGDERRCVRVAEGVLGGD